jgi:hypothetical protein
VFLENPWNRLRGVKEKVGYIGYIFFRTAPDIKNILALLMEITLHERQLYSIGGESNAIKKYEKAIP